MSQTVGFSFHIALYPVFEVGDMCVDCVEVRITLPLVITKAHQSQESPQPFALPPHLCKAERGLLIVSGLALRDGREDKDSPRVRGTYVRGSIVRLLAGTEHIVCDADWHPATSILLLTWDYISEVNKPNPGLLIRT